MIKKSLLFKSKEFKGFNVDLKHMFGLQMRYGLVRYFVLDDKNNNCKVLRCHGSYRKAKTICL
jgi:hypothetical protein